MNKNILILTTIGLILTGCNAGTDTVISDNHKQETINVTDQQQTESEKLLQKDNHKENVVNPPTPDEQSEEELPPEEKITQEEKTEIKQETTTENEAPKNEQSIHLIAEPADLLVLVNKEHALPPDYVPSDLVAPNVPFYFSEDLPKRYMRKEAAERLEQLFAAAYAEQLELLGASGYRSYSRQDAIFASNVKRKGETEARRVSAEAGQSEHQTGLAMDLTSKYVGYDLIEEFGETKEGIWLKENAHKFGFIIRYPQGKEHITGYIYEPWHIRYLGVDVASAVYESGLTLEEYFANNQ